MWSMRHFSLLLLFHFINGNTNCSFEYRNIDGRPLTKEQNKTFETLKKNCSTKMTNHCFIILEDYREGYWASGCIWKISYYGNFCHKEHIYEEDGCKRIGSSYVYLCCCRGTYCNSEQYLLKSPAYSNNVTSSTISHTTTPTTRTTSRKTTTSIVVTTEVSSFPIWIIFVILGLLVLIVAVIVVVILLVRRQRKKQKERLKAWLKPTESQVQPTQETAETAEKPKPQKPGLRVYENVESTTIAPAPDGKPPKQESKPADKALVTEGTQPVSKPKEKTEEKEINEKIISD